MIPKSAGRRAEVSSLARKLAEKEDELETLRAERQKWEEERELWRELVRLERIHAELCGDPYCTTERCTRRRDLRRRLGLEVQGE